MSQHAMTSLQRVLTTLGHQEPDRVPLFLLAAMHGAKELGLSIEGYFARPEHVVEGQLRLRERLQDDCLYGFFYAAVEVEAAGVPVVYRDDGPPTAGEPFLHDAGDVLRFEAPRVAEAPCLQKVLTATRGLKERIGDEAPIIGVVMSPFSLPVMQMGFEAYLDLMTDRPDALERLLRVNEGFCVEWANAQLAAGATAICYFDPLASSSMVSPEVYRRTGFLTAQRTLARIQGPAATHLASGRCLPVLDDLAQTGTAVVGVSSDEDLALLAERAAGRVTLLGNLDGISMRRWSAQEAEEQVKAAIAAAGPGGGFILSDNHGEIPWQVPLETLEAIAEAVRRWGRYPLDELHQERAL